MEDACKIVESLKGSDGLFYSAIFDGHGGALCVNELKHMLHLSLETQLGLGYDTSAALTRSFHYVDSMLLSIAAKQVVDFQAKAKATGGMRNRLIRTKETSEAKIRKSSGFGLAPQPSLESFQSHPNLETEN